MLALVLVAVAPATVAEEQDVHPFYRGLLADGIRAFDAADYDRASEELRIAAFGLLDAPEELAVALTRLALAQDAIGDAEGAAVTQRRLAELEARFGAVVVASAAPGTVEPAESAEHEAPQTGPSDRVAATATRLCVSWTGDGECLQRPSPALDPALDPGAPGPEELAALERLADTAVAKSSSKKLRRALNEARPLAARFPEWSEMQRVTGLLAARSGAHEEALQHFEVSGPLEADPIDRYYLAVALFEAGRVDEAADTLREVLPLLEQSREVRKNAKRILSVESPA